MALLVGDDVGPDDLRPESGLVEPALEDRRVGRRLYDRDRVEVDVPLVRLDHRVDVNALDLPVEACVEPVRPVPHRYRQLARVRVHADDEPRLVLDAARAQLHFSTHCAILSSAATYWSRRLLQGCKQVFGVFRPRQVVSAGAPVPYHTPIRGSLSTPNIAALSSGEQYNTKQT